MDEIDNLLNYIHALPDFEKCIGPEKFTKETLKNWQHEKDETLLDVINAFLDLIIDALKPVTMLCGIILFTILLWFWFLPAIKYNGNPAKMDNIGMFEIWNDEHIDYVNDVIEIEWTNKGVPAPDYMTIDGRKFKVVIKHDD